MTKSRNNLSSCSVAEQRLLTDIAAKHLRIETLDTRWSDSADFHEVSVWAIREALEAAFKAGAEKGRKS